MHFVCSWTDKLFGIALGFRRFSEKKVQVVMEFFGTFFAEAVKNRFFIESGRPESEWKLYNTQVSQLA